ncbi:MAG: RdgB/HAM1 family non-canonical purine NTP pyrophosphatase [Kosmotogaceae bacterium]
MILYLVTTNPNKLKEINDILPDNFEIKSINEIVSKNEVEENGDTFLQNAIKKVEAFKEQSVYLLSDDSGLEIECLKGFPGVKSARYLEDASYHEKMESILKKLKNCENRTARFRCSAIFYDPFNENYFASEGYVKGTISRTIKGKKGFGYDPIFVPDGYNKTFGELGHDVKSKISHRVNAFKKLFSLIDLYFEQE